MLDPAEIHDGVTCSDFVSDLSSVFGSSSAILCNSVGLLNGRYNCGELMHMLFSVFICFKFLLIQVLLFDSTNGE